MRFIALPLVLAFPLGCTHEQPTASGYCLAPLSYAVVVAVYDSLSGVSVVDSTRGVVQAGSYVDSLHRAGSPPSLLVGGAQLGTYRVTIDRLGYRGWMRDGVAVTQRGGPCGTIVSVHLLALLQRAP